jgi:ADP-ribose pyrophosphatase YjhB (NUDIX family)
MTSPPSAGQGILDWARKVQAVAQTGLAFTRDPYDRERYLQLQELVTGILVSELGMPLAAARAFWQDETGYATPKVAVRGALFRNGQVLLVRERSDGRWTMPGGWVDVNDAPSAAVVREIHEESGYEARVLKLAALVDKNTPRHGLVRGLHHVYKLFFLCELTGGDARTSIETDAVGFFALDALPELSTPRVTRSLIERMHAHHRQPDLPTDFD